MIKIVNIKGIYVFPIFKNGHSSIVNYADANKCKWLFNEQCNRTNSITVFLRKPFERFMSGVHTFVEHERRKLLAQVYSQNKNVKDFLSFDSESIFEKIDAAKISNEHFMSQYEWLQRLHRFYNGIVILKTVDHLQQLIVNRDGPNIPKLTHDRRERIKKINVNLDHDNILYNQYVGAHIPLDKLLKGVEHVLS